MDFVSLFTFGVHLILLAFGAANRKKTFFDKAVFLVSSDYMFLALGFLLGGILG